jgi:hypothetical protein
LSRRRVAVGIVWASGVVLALACARDVVGPDVPVAVALDFLPFPSVVVGDTLRDTTGAVAPVRARAFNYLGEELPDIPFHYLVLDRGATVDTATGIIRGDSLRDTPVRVVGRLGNLQTQTQPLAIVRAPATLDPVNGLDTLEYSLTDTTQNVSAAMSVRLLSGGEPPVGVRAWVVSYMIVHEPGTGSATIVEGSRESLLDTTGTDGTASRQVRLHVQNLSTPVDSVVLEASAKYRGSHVDGSPARLVVYIRPRTP